MELFQAEIIRLPSYANMYSYCRCLLNRAHCLLVATNDGVYRIHTHYNPSLYLASLARTVALEPLKFDRIPPKAQIISIDAFNPSKHQTMRHPFMDSPIIGITVRAQVRIKGTDRLKHKFYFHIYGSKLPYSLNLKYSFEDIVSDVIIFKLSFAPLLLTHTEIFGGSDFLLSDCAGNLNVYRRQSDGSFRELRKKEHPLPHLNELSSGIVSLEIKLLSSDTTSGIDDVIVAAGCQDGLALVSHCGDKGTHSFRTYVDGPITSVNLFDKPYTSIRKGHTSRHMSKVTENQSLCMPSTNSKNTLSEIPPQKKQSARKFFSSHGQGGSTPNTHLLISSAVGYGVMYGNVHHNEFKYESFLPSSDRFDSVLCAHVADINLDGTNELLLGTYGQQVLIYSIRKPETEPPPYNSQSIPYISSFYDMEYGLGIDDEIGINRGDYKLDYSIPLNHPVYSLDTVDLNGDGVEELIITTMYSVSIQQWDSDLVNEKLTCKIGLLEEIEEYEKLLFAGAFTKSSRKGKEKLKHAAIGSMYNEGKEKSKRSGKKKTKSKEKK